MVNIIEVSTRGVMFLKVMDCKGEVKDDPLFVNILIQTVEQFGPQCVVQTIINNAKNCRVASNTFFWMLHAMHSFNLMLQKIDTKIERNQKSV